MAQAWEEEDRETTDGDETDDAAAPTRLRRRSTISAFSADGRGNFAETYAGPATRGAMLRREWGADYDNAMAQRQAYAGYEQVGRRAQAMKQHNRDVGRNALASVMLQAERYGGQLPQAELGPLNRDLGFDGKTRGIFGCGYTQNGDFVLDYLEMGQDGRPMRSRQTIPRLEQYNFLNGMTGMVGRDYAARRRQQLIDNYGYRDSELPKVMSDAGVAAGAQVRRQQAADVLKQAIEKNIAAVAKSKTEVQFVDDLSKNRMMQAFFGRGAPIYMERKEDDPNANVDGLVETNDPFRKDDNGNVVKDANGRPVLREGVTQARDAKGNPMYHQLDPEETLKNAVTYYRNAHAGASGRDDGFSRLVDMYREMYGPKPLSPEEAEIQQRQRQNALDDQRRADVMRGRDEQLIHYLDANGTHKVGSGYVVDGKVYDNRGNEMQGVRLADRNGNPLEQRSQDGGGGIAGTSAADVVAGGGNTLTREEAKAELKRRRAERIENKPQQFKQNIAFNNVLLGRLQEGFPNITMGQMESGEYDNEILEAAKVLGDKEIMDYARSKVQEHERMREANRARREQQAEEEAKIDRRGDSLRGNRALRKITETYKDSPLL